MSMLNHAPAGIAAGRGELLLAYGRALARGLYRLAQARRSRKLVKDLRDFDDAQLADIGLRRGDVESALQLPLSADPVHYLVRQRQNPLGRSKRF